MTSLIFFALTVYLSLLTLPITGNIILYINGLQRAILDNDSEEVKKYNKKTGDALASLKRLDRWSHIIYLAGITSLLVFAGISLFT